MPTRKRVRTGWEVVKTRGSSFRSPPSFAGLPRPKRPRRRAARPLAAEPATDPLETLYEQRLAAQREHRTVTTYRWLRRDMLRIAARISGRPLTLSQLLGDEALLGQVLVTDEREDGRRCSKSVIAHRRTAIRSVATMLRPELQTALGRDPHDVIRDALRAVAERRGGGYRINAGTPHTRGGPTPNTQELRAIIAAMGTAGGWLGLRDRALATLLVGTAARVTALRTLDGADCHVLPDDRVRVLLHQKNARERHEVELGRASREALRLYVFAFNEAMRGTGWPDRIVLGEPGPIWRTERRAQMSDRALRNALRRACRVAGTQDYTPHAFRRAWATAASKTLPRWEGALGGGWHGTERFDASYVTPSRASVWRKLGALHAESERDPPESERTDHAPAHAL